MAADVRPSVAPGQTLAIMAAGDVFLAQRSARAMAEAVGFDARTIEEIAIVVSELASNLVRHAGGGEIRLSPLADGRRVGVQIEAVDHGPGITDVEQAMADGFSTAGGLGFGLGAVNRLMDEVDITTAGQARAENRVSCRRWLRATALPLPASPLDIGVATRAHPRMRLNGDAFVVHRWDQSALVAVIDGVGHGDLAHDAARAAQQFVESHSDQPMTAIFRGAGRACGTRGVVMAAARIDWAAGSLTFASVGNVEARLLRNDGPASLIARRGIVGLNGPSPTATEHDWRAESVLVLHSDGVDRGWRWEDIPQLRVAPADAIARHLLRSCARTDDDATVLVVKARR